MERVTKEDYINKLCLENEVINTRNLDKTKKAQWLDEFNIQFGTSIGSETFSRYLRDGKEYTRSEMGLSPDVEKQPIKIVQPTKGMGNILVIGDLHEPFCRKGYREFCIEMKLKHQCETIIFIGDIMDGHYTSFHSSDPDSPYSGIGELEATKKNISAWHNSFPDAYVCLGNHDSHANRKAFVSGISSKWIKSISEILETPSWTYSDEFTFDDVKYCHGIGRQAESRVKEDMLSCVQGHFHSKGYVKHFVGTHKRLFAMQVGCGIDDKSFAFAYGKHFSKSHISVGIVQSDGTLPFLEYMDLERDYTI